MQNTLLIFAGKLLASALVTAGTVYFVVDMSLRGMESSIQTTNKRIDDLRNEINSTLDLKFANLELQIKNEFLETRKEINKAELSPSESIKTIKKLQGQNIEPVLTGSSSAKPTVVIGFDKESFDGRGNILDIVSGIDRYSDWYKNNESIFAEIRGGNYFMFGIAYENGKSSTSVSNSIFLSPMQDFLLSKDTKLIFNEDTLPIFRKALAEGCFTLEKKPSQNAIGNVEFIYRPREKMLVGSNGMVCPIQTTQ